jgi:hypothetical protein
MNDNGCESRVQNAAQMHMEKIIRKKLQNLGIPPDCIGKAKFEFTLEMGASPFCIQGKVTVPIVFFIKYGSPAEDINRERENTELMKSKDPEHFVTPITIPPEEDGLFVAEFFEGDRFHSIILNGNLSEELKLDVAREVYTALFRMYETNMKDITVPVYKAHFKRIEQRLEEKINRDPSFSKYKFQTLVVNGVKVPSAYTLLKKAQKFRDQLESRKATTVPCDAQPDNILVKLPNSIRFIDLLNLDPEGDDSVDIGKNRHWLKGYIVMRQIRDNITIDPKSFVNYSESTEKDGSIVINYDLKGRVPDIAQKIYALFLEKLEEFSKRIGDNWWYERMLLGSARAWIGGIPYHQNHELAVIMLCEGLLELDECVRQLESKLAARNIQEVRT